MKSFICIVFFFIYNITISQNSIPYVNKSLIKVHSFNQSIVDSLLKRNVIPISCRGSILESNLIVDSLTLNFLRLNQVNFSIIHDNLSELIDLEMQAIEQEKSKRSSNWYSTYRSFSEINNHLNDIVLTSDIATQIVIGQSYEGRDINVIKIGLDNNLEDKPAIFINGCQHAREWITPMATTYLIEELITQYNINLEINNFLNLVDVYILPVSNPDGYVYTWEEDRWWRKNRQPNLNSECIGTDLNRNWNYDWNGQQSTSEDPCSFIYVGSNPFSASETQVISDYILTIPNLVNHIDVHNYSALIVGPWASSEDLTEDNDEIYCLGTRMQSAVSNTHDYPYIFGTGTVNDLLYLISGGMVDWVYGYLSSLSFLYELRPASLYYFDSNFDGLGAFDNDENAILPTCEEFFSGVIEMIKWASIETCEVAVGCSDPEAENYYCNTLEGSMGCLYTVNPNIAPQSNGAYNLLEYSLPVGFIDDGSCIYDNSIEEHQNNRQIIKAIDILGRENIQKGFQIELYDNGTVEKQYIY